MYLYMHTYEGWIQKGIFEQGFSLKAKVWSSVYVENWQIKY